MLEGESANLNPERPQLTEAVVAQRLLQAASAKESLDGGDTRGNAIAKRVALWKANPQLPTFKYEPSTPDPNSKVATISIKDREIGKLIIHHHPLKKKWGLADSLRVLTGKPAPQFRETMQFINSKHESLLLEESDGGIPTHVDHPDMPGDAYLPESDTFAAEKPFVSDFFGLIAKMHEHGHAYRFSSMDAAEQAMFISDNMTNSTQIQQDEDPARMGRVITEETAASAAAIVRLNQVLQFLGVSDKELPTDQIIDLCAEAILSRSK